MTTRDRFEKEFGVIGSTVRESWFTRYLGLIEIGISHKTATALVRAERAMANPTDEQYYEAMKDPNKANIR